jgi:hypothetical protein
MKGGYDTMKKYQRFGLGWCKRCYLYCIMEDDKDYFYVLNGDWYGTLLPDDKITIHTPWGNRTEDYQIIYKGPFPKDVGDYNAGILFIENQLKKTKIRIFFESKLWSLQGEWKRVKLAIAGFKKVYNCNKESSFFEDVDDDIPF